MNITITDALIAIGVMLAIWGLMSLVIWDVGRQVKRAEKKRIQYLEEFLESRRPPFPGHEDKQ
ncbi:hypothetical protein [Cobetia marina]|uniref:hypothetical protein n=1 Tax=Cobetia marina TaxID=28258 RepID=UPI00384D6A25